MSLINDALKRAKQAQHKNPPPAPAATPLRPVESVRRAPPSRSLLLPLLAAAVLILIGGVAILMAFKRGASEPAAPTLPLSAKPIPETPAHSTPKVPAASPVTTPSHSATSVAVRPPEVVVTNLPQVAAAVPIIVTQTVFVVETAKPPATVKVEAPPPLPKLQGILFNPARPTAFLNGKSLLVGGRLGEYTVVAITKQAVTIERAGQTNVLTMEE